MQIFSGANHFPKRKTFDDVVNPKSATKPRRLKIVEATVIRGTPVYPGSVFEFDTARIDADGGWDDYAALINSLKAVRVSISEPLFTAPQPAPSLPPVKEAPSTVSALASELIRQIGIQAAPVSNQPKKN